MERVYKPLIAQHLSSLRQMVFLMGPRQVGKTTLSHESASGQDPLYLSLDNPTDKLLFIEGPEAVAKQAGLEEIRESHPLLIFDEIHKFSKWKSFLKGFFDLYEKKTKIIVTGSARLNVYKRGGDNLMGRYFYYRIHPLSVAEIVSPTMIETEIRPPAPISQERVCPPLPRWQVRSCFGRMDGTARKSAPGGNGTPRIRTRTTGRILRRR